MCTFFSFLYSSVYMSLRQHPHHGKQLQRLYLSLRRSWPKRVVCLLVQLPVFTRNKVLKVLNREQNAGTYFSSTCVTFADRFGRPGKRTVSSWAGALYGRLKRFNRVIYCLKGALCGRLKRFNRVIHCLKGALCGRSRKLKRVIYC